MRACHRPTASAFGATPGPLGNRTALHGSLEASSHRTARTSLRGPGQFAWTSGLRADWSLLARMNARPSSGEGPRPSTVRIERIDSISMQGSRSSILREPVLPRNRFHAEWKVAKDRLLVASRSYQRVRQSATCCFICLGAFLLMYVKDPPGALASAQDSALREMCHAPARQLHCAVKIAANCVGVRFLDV